MTDPRRQRPVHLERHRRRGRARVALDHRLNPPEMRAAYRVAFGGGSSIGERAEHEIADRLRVRAVRAQIAPMATLTTNPSLRFINSS